MHQKENLMMKKFKLYLIEKISSTLTYLSLPNIDFNLTQPKKKEFGDLSSNLPLLIGSKQKSKPLQIGRSPSFLPLLDWCYPSRDLKNCQD